LSNSCQTFVKFFQSDGVDGEILPCFSHGKKFRRQPSLLLRFKQGLVPVAGLESGGLVLRLCAKNDKTRANLHELNFSCKFGGVMQRAGAQQHTRRRIECRWNLHERQ
jgi:hypothetical protein